MSHVSCVIVVFVFDIVTVSCVYVSCVICGIYFVFDIVSVSCVNVTCVMCNVFFV